MGSHLQTAQAVATVLIAVYVASIGTFQWRTAQEKLRLDLYNRRFEVYVQAITFMQALLQWQSVPDNEQVQTRVAFVRAVRESRFLFASEPAILALLEELYNRSFDITSLLEQESLAAGPDEYRKRLQQKTAQEAWLLDFTAKLEPLLVPYLAFHQRGLRAGKW